MMFSVASPILASGLMFAFQHATRPGAVICGVLIVLSIACWTLLLSKVWMISGARNANRGFLGAYHHSSHPLELFQSRNHHSAAPLYHLYHAAARELAFHLLGTDEADATFATRLRSASRIMPSQMSAVATAMDRASGEARVRMEARMNVVSVILRFSPFLGLLGTVWSLMETFSETAASGEAATLQALTGGLSAALLPTLLGLLLAVPGFVAFSWVAEKIRLLVVRQDHFASEFCSVIERHFVDHRPTADELPSIGSLVTPNMPAFGSVQSQRAANGERNLAAAEA